MENLLISFLNLFRKNKIETLSSFAKKVAKITNGEYHSVKVEMEKHSSQEKYTFNYNCYIHSRGFYNGKTTDEVIKKLTEDKTENITAEVIIK